VAEPFVDPSQGCAGGGHACADGMAQIVNADRSEPGSSGCGLEAFGELCRVEHHTELRMGESEVGWRLEARPRVVQT
jgi:hypothetical protein